MICKGSVHLEKKMAEELPVRKKGIKDLGHWQNTRLTYMKSWVSSQALQN